MSDTVLYVICGLIAVALLVYGIMSGEVKHWLCWAVAEAERELGSGTGQLKLHMVYNWFVERFPIFAKIVPFDIFSKWVDIALLWLNEQIDKNINIKNEIEGYL